MATFFTQFAEFHFLRPNWLLAMLPALLLCVLLWRQKKHRSAWRGLIDSHLLKYLIEGEVSQSFRWQIFALALAWLLAAIALAGPSWEKIPQPIHKSEAAVVILLDLSPSLMAEDLKPSRLVRTRYKITDYLNARKDEGVTGLIAYAGEAHVVSPLTDDINTITNLLPALEPAMMPLAGSNIEMAVAMAAQMFTDAGILRGEILAVTDGVDSEAFASIKQSLQGKNIRLSILGVGSVEGAPIPTGNGGFVRDNNRDIVVAKLNRNELRNLSAELGGAYTDLRPDEKDIDILIASSLQPHLDDTQRISEREFDSWRDQGQWLALLLLPFVALCFRKGWVLSIVFIISLQPETSLAFEWEDLWLRKDQQGQRSLQQGDPNAAAQQFQSPEWRGTANYRANNFDAAAEAFANGDSAQDHYNRGNALAKANKLEEALSAYETAMEKQDNFEDAQFNHDLVKNLLEQQKQQQSQDGDSQNQQQDKNQQANNSQQQDGQQSENGEGQDQQGQQQDQQQAQNDQQQSGNTNVDEEAAQDLAAREQESEQLNQQQAQQSQQAHNGDQSSEDKSGDPTQQLLADAENRNKEEQQALEQWLRQVPDDPSGLMRRKFEYQHRKLLQDYRSGRWQPPENQAYERY